MKKTLVTAALAAALLTPASIEAASPARRGAPRPAVQSEQRPSEAPSPLIDLSRWLTERLRALADPFNPPPDPEPLPAPNADPGPGVVCPDRVHCPIG